MGLLARIHLHMFNLAPGEVVKAEHRPVLYDGYGSDSHQNALVTSYMDKTHLVSADQLNEYAKGRAGEANVPELIWMLVNRVPDLRVCRIPYGDAINQSGLRPVHAN